MKRLLAVQPHPLALLWAFTQALYRALLRWWCLHWPSHDSSIALVNAINHQGPEIQTFPVTCAHCKTKGTATVRNINTPLGIRIHYAWTGQPLPRARARKPR